MKRNYSILVISLLIIIAVISAFAVFRSLSKRDSSQTYILITQLDWACREYKNQFGVYPPGDTDQSSLSLYKCLGFPQVIIAGDGQIRSMPPLMHFTAEMVNGDIKSSTAERPLQILDQWGRPIRYLNPGRHNTGGVDIWSLGSDGIQDRNFNDPVFDDITNWVKN